MPAHALLIRDLQCHSKVDACRHNNTCAIRDGCHTGRRGVDGVPCREFDTLSTSSSAQAASVFSAYFPVRVILSKRSLPSAVRWSRLPPETWPEIQQRAKRDSLRHIAEDYGVSH